MNKVYARLDKGSDVMAFKPETYDVYTIIVAYFNYEGEVIEDKKYAGSSIHLSSLKELRDKMFELRTLGYMIREADLDNISNELTK